jgi:superfamily II DNA or RNA helicase
MPSGAIALRAHQLEAYHAFHRFHARGGHTGLISLATGGGKTLLATAIARDFPRTLFTVNRAELITQTQGAFRRMSPDREQGLVWRQHHDTSKPVTVGMINTLGSRLHRIPRDAFDFVVVDEAHHSSAPTWAKVIEHFSPARFILGLSATPERTDGASLADTYDEMIYEAGIKDLVATGDLVRPVGIRISSDANLDAVRQTAGDLNEGDLARIVNTTYRNNLVIRAYLTHARGRQTIVFTAGVDHAQSLARAFREAGVRADWVSGADRDREAKLEALKRGQFDVICNAMLLVEGFDHTAIGAVIMARPTSSKLVFTQAVGRGLRKHPGKQDCLIIDVCDTTTKHRLVNVWKFWGTERPPQDDQATDLLEHDLTTEERKAQEQAALEQRTAEIVANFRDAFAAPVNLEAYTAMVDLLLPAPSVPSDKWAHLGKLEWHRQLATEKQLEVLRAHGFDTSATRFTRGSASQLIDALPPTSNQRKLLLAYGYDAMPDTWTRAQATLAIETAQRERREPNWATVDALRAPRFPPRKTPRAMQPS